MTAVYIDTARCRQCYICVRSCPIGAMSVAGGMPQANPEKCIGCGACAKACPFEIIAMHEKDTNEGGEQ